MPKSKKTILVISKHNTIKCNRQLIITKLSLNLYGFLVPVTNVNNISRFQKNPVRNCGKNHGKVFNVLYIKEPWAMI